MKSKSKVFILHRTTVLAGDGIARLDKYDLSSAEYYGELVEIFVDEEARQEAKTIMERLAGALVNFSDNDALLCTGDPLILVIAGLVLENRCPKWNRIRVLKWDKYKKGYRTYYIPRVPQLGG